MNADKQTLDVYDQKAATFADDWESQPAPIELQDAVRRFFRKGLTADIGCGSGRDTAWLIANGYPAIGFDASQGLITEARRRHPGINFRHAVLPDLSGVEDGRFDNILCETVIMHLRDAAVSASVTRLLSILRPGGMLYLSWRVNSDDVLRDKHGRLYANWDAELVLAPLRNTSVLIDEETVSASSQKVTRRIVARKPG